MKYHLDNRYRSFYTRNGSFAAHLDNCGLLSSEDKETSMSTTINGQMKLCDFVDYWLKNYKLNTIKKATYARLAESARSLNSYNISQMPIEQINLFTLQSYVNELVSNKLAYTTIKKQLGIVTAPLKIAAAMHIIPSDPSIGVRMPSKAIVLKKPKDVSAYTDEEQEKLTKVLATRQYPGYDTIWFMIETGLRSGEALALKWSDIDLKKRRMRVHATILKPIDCKHATYQDSPKSDSSNRTIPLSAKATEILLQLQAEAKTEWVFEFSKHRLSYQSLARHTKKACAEAGIPFKGEHVFRHTFATNCYYKKMDIKILSKILGHAKVDITYNTYINLYGDGFDEMLAALDAC